MIYKYKDICIANELSRLTVSHSGNVTRITMPLRCIKFNYKDASVQGNYVKFVKLKMS